jgi:hypothetical protein
MKPSVVYTDALRAPRIGARMRVQVLGDARFPNGTWVWTTFVRLVRGKEFETDNTRYIPGTIDESKPVATGGVYGKRLSNPFKR